MKTNPSSSSPGLKTVTLTLAVFLAVNGLILNVVIWYADPPGRRATVLPHSRDLLLGRSGDDSWGPMATALEYTRSRQTTPLYSEVFFNRGVRFQYPPSALFALEAMYAAGRERVRTSDFMVFDNGPSVNDILGWMFIAATAVATWLLLEMALHRDRSPPLFERLALLRGLVVTGLTLTFYPLVVAFTLGQIQVWINGIFAVSLLCWTLGRKALAGFLIGLICVIKPHFGLFFIWAGLRRDWRFVALGAATVVLGLTASVFAFGWSAHIDYLRVISFLAERGEAYYPNQSFNGLLNRWMALSEPHLYHTLEFRFAHFPPFNPWVYWGSLVGSTTILLAALFHFGPKGDRTFEFGIMAVSLTLAAPIAWVHHYGVFFPIFAILFASTVQRPAKAIWLALCYLFVSASFPFTNLVDATWLNVLQSYVFLSALGLLLFMHRQLSKAENLVGK